MKLSILATAFAVWTANVAAIGVTGAAEGFAKGVTGGGSAAPVYPKVRTSLDMLCCIERKMIADNTSSDQRRAGLVPW
jgi:hypothetical protein